MIKKLHKTLGLVATPFLLLTSVTGVALLFRKDEMYSKETKELMLGLHNWEIAAKYVGAVLAAVLIVMVLTGLMMWRRSKQAK